MADRLSLGAYRVGITFNPSNNAKVDDIKRRAADMIDWCEDLRPTADAEVARLLSLAQTHIEDAAMWAVKAVTKQPR